MLQSATTVFDSTTVKVGVVDIKVMVEACKVELASLIREHDLPHTVHVKIEKILGDMENIRSVMSIDTEEEEGHCTYENTLIARLDKDKKLSICIAGKKISSARLASDGSMLVHETIDNCTLFFGKQVEYMKISLDDKIVEDMGERFIVTSKLLDKVVSVADAYGVTILLPPEMLFKSLKKVKEDRKKK